MTGVNWVGEKIEGGYSWGRDKAEDAANSVKEFFAVSFSASPDPDKDHKRSLEKIKNNKEANKVAKKNGYEDAEALKEDFAQGNGSRFNITRDTKTGEIGLQSIKGNVQISTGPEHCSKPRRASGTGRGHSLSIKLKMVALPCAPPGV